MGGPNRPVGDRRLNAILDAVDDGFKQALTHLLDNPFKKRHQCIKANLNADRDRTIKAIIEAARKPFQGKGK